MALLMLGVLLIVVSYFFFLPCVQPLIRKRYGDRLTREEEAALGRGLLRSGILFAVGVCMAAAGIALGL